MQIFEEWLTLHKFETIRNPSTQLSKYSYRNQINTNEQNLSKPRKGRGRTETGVLWELGLAQHPRREFCPVPCCSLSGLGNIISHSQDTYEMTDWKSMFYILRKQINKINKVRGENYTTDIRNKWSEPRFEWITRTEREAKTNPRNEDCSLHALRFKAEQSWNIHWVLISGLFQT